MVGTFTVKNAKAAEHPLPIRCMGRHTIPAPLGLDPGLARAIWLYLKIYSTNIALIHSRGRT